MGAATATGGTESGYTPVDLTDVGTRFEQRTRLSRITQHP